MLIKTHLFVSKERTGRHVPLSAVLDGHKRSTLDDIKAVSDLDQMTDSFLAGIVKESLVQPLHFHFDKMTRETRSEDFDASQLPPEFIGDRGRRYPKTVARISIPFTGRRELLEIMPNRQINDFPVGQVSGDTVQFDVVFWGLPNDNEQVKQKIERTRKLLEFYGGAANEQVKAFNESLPDQIKAAFAANLEELTKQHAALDDIGIPEKQEPPVPTSAPPRRAEEGKERAEQIIQIIGTMYVQTLDQTNYNVGDVNNAIQGG